MEKSIQEILDEDRANSPLAKLSEKEIERLVKNQLLSIILTGCPGRKKTEDEKRRIGESHKGKITSEETKIKIGKANSGRKLGPSWNKGKSMPEETKKKLSDTLRSLDRPVWNEGKTMSDSTKHKVSETKTKYRYITPKGIFEIKIEMINAFPEYTLGQLERYTTYSLKGFSRELK